MRRPIMVTCFGAPARRCALRTLSAAALAAMVMPLEQMPVQAAQPVTEFDAPHASKVSAQICLPYCGTTAFDNNDLGDIVGTYTDQQIVPHGFLRLRNGQVIPFDAPGAGVGANLDQGTAAYAINNLGEIAGQYQDQNYVFHGFVRHPDGTFESPIDVADAGTQANQGTMAWDINGGGTIAGIYFDANNVQHGFIRSPANEAIRFDPPGSMLTYTCEETCLTPDGTVAGTYFDLNFVRHGFVRHPDGTFEPPIDFPGPTTIGTGVSSINANGEIAGSFQDSSNAIHGFVRHSDGSFTPPIDDPAASQAGTQIRGTQPLSINLAGATTGVYVDANGNGLGFERFPDGHFANFAAPGTYTRPSSNNVEGEVAGWSVDANNVNHGFVWRPSTPTARATD